MLINVSSFLYLQPYLGGLEDPIESFDVGIAVF